MGRRSRCCPRSLHRVIGREGRAIRANLGVGKEEKGPCILSYIEFIEHAPSRVCLLRPPERRLVDDDSYFLNSVKKIIFKFNEDFT